MVKLGPHQIDIMECLKNNYNYSRPLAKELVEKYYNNMERIGWVYSAEEWAEQLDYAEKNGISPSEWDSHLDSVDEDIELTMNDSAGPNVKYDVDSALTEVYGKFYHNVMRGRRYKAVGIKRGSGRKGKRDSVHQPLILSEEVTSQFVASLSHISNNDLFMNENRKTYSSRKRKR